MKSTLEPHPPKLHDIVAVGGVEVLAREVDALRSVRMTGSLTTLTWLIQPFSSCCSRCPVKVETGSPIRFVRRKACFFLFGASGSMPCTFSSEVTVCSDPTGGFAGKDRPRRRFAPGPSGSPRRVVSQAPRKPLGSPIKGQLGRTVIVRSHCIGGPAFCKCDRSLLYMLEEIAL